MPICGKICRAEQKYMPFFGTITERDFRKKFQSMETYTKWCNAAFRIRRRSRVLDFFQDSRIRVKPTVATTGNEPYRYFYVPKMSSLVVFAGYLFCRWWCGKCMMQHCMRNQSSNRWVLLGFWEFLLKSSSSMPRGRRWNDGTLRCCCPWWTLLSKCYYSMGSSHQ